MKFSELSKLGIPGGAPMKAAGLAIQQAIRAGLSKREIRTRLCNAATNPKGMVDDPHFGALARELAGSAPARPEQPRATPVPYREWGTGIDALSREQLHNACVLPVSVRAALMPDAHPGYGLPIGGVLATHNAVIPYAVGVDIACRMKMTVLDLPPDTIETKPDTLIKAIDTETRFGVGAKFQRRRQHSVMDEDWDVSPVTREHKDTAYGQLGTSGSGNHFVEFGVLEIEDDALGIAPGRYLALLTHSGSRGTGAKVCEHYSRIAAQRMKHLPRHLQRLAWLGLDEAEGHEYWAAMQLMGRYAAANHACIHRHIAQHLGAQVLFDVENHHNFAWKEVHDGMEVVVHRKGATPASAGVLGIIPGTMASPAYLVRGKGNAASLESASHGAGRVMSRSEAKKRLRWDDARARLRDSGVRLLSAGIDEVPMVYKDIDAVMAAQTDLVETLGRFHPRIVKMAGAGEPAED